MEMLGNPKSALDALSTTSRLTLGKVAMLCRLDSPILAGRCDDLTEMLAAIYVIEQPLADSLSNFPRLRDAAIVKYDALTPSQYRDHLSRALDEVAEFFSMLPRPSPDAKKNSGTDGAQSSQSGCAGPTDTE